MDRKDKIGGWILGTALFLGLGYFIYTAWKTNPSGLDYSAEDSFEPSDLDDEEYLDEEPAAGEETTEPAPAPPVKEAPKK